MKGNPNISDHGFKKGKSGNPNGRPRKYVSLLKEQGYKVSEVNDAIQAMMAMTLDELKEVWDNKEATILEKTIAGAMRKSLEKGSLYSMETLMTRVYGHPKQSVDMVAEVTTTDLSNKTADELELILKAKKILDE